MALDPIARPHVLANAVGAGGTCKACGGERAHVFLRAAQNGAHGGYCLLDYVGQLLLSLQPFEIDPAEEHRLDHRARLRAQHEMSKARHFAPDTSLEALWQAVFD